MEYVIQVNRINKYFGQRHVVKDLSMQINKGEIYGFLGPNGSGKTTSIRMMCGLLTPDSGTGHCLGYDIVKENFRIKEHIGYMTQRFSFWDDLSIRENLAFVADIYRLDQAKERINKTLDDLGLTSRQTQLAGTLSGGWKQRMALAACMLHEPEILLLDEPTAGVDPSGRKDFWEELHRLAARGISVLVSTHYMDEAERCHKLAYIAYGTMLAQGTRREILAKYPLYTWRIQGEKLDELKKEADKMPEITQSVLLGEELHITGQDKEQTALAVHRLCEDKGLAAEPIAAEPIDTKLEDLFIYLMNTYGEKS